MHRQTARGFTLIEVLAALVIVGILVAIALPAYNGSIRKSRRSDAVGALAALQQGQERWRANRDSYTTTLTDACPGCSGTSPGGYYTVSIATADANGYVVTAAAVAGTSQADDTQCTTMRLQLQGGNVFYGGCNGCAAPSAGTQVSDPNRCWAK